MTQALFPFSSDANFSAGAAPRVIQSNAQNGAMSNTQTFARFVSPSQNLSVDAPSFEAVNQVGKLAAISANHTDNEISTRSAEFLGSDSASSPTKLLLVYGSDTLILAQKSDFQDEASAENRGGAFIGTGSDFPPATLDGFLNDEVWEEISWHDETGFFRLALHAAAFERSGVFGRELISTGWQDAYLLPSYSTDLSTSTRSVNARLNHELPVSMNGQGNRTASNSDGAPPISGNPVADAFVPGANLSTIGERARPVQNISIEARNLADDAGPIRVLLAPSRDNLNTVRLTQTMVSQGQSEQGKQQEAGEQSVSRLHDAIAKRLAGLAGKAQSQTVNVVLQVSSSGVSVIARAGEMLRSNRDELREEIRAVLAEFGITGATIDIHADSNLPRGDRFQGES